jgi:hypothetical protein
MRTQTYHPKTAERRFTLTEICAMADNGLAALRPFNERLRMRLILKNNIEAQKVYARNGHISQAAGHLNIADKLAKFLKKIPANAKAK